MNVDTVVLDEQEYFVVETIELKNNLYYFLVNEKDNKDICIRKKIVENNVEYLSGLDDEQEFNFVLQTYLNNRNLKKTVNVYPIGTIIKLKDYDKKVMIVGYLMRGQDGLVYDYCGCEYPEGISNKNEYLYFDRVNIAQIEKLGYIDDETKIVLSKVELSITMGN